MSRRNPMNERYRQEQKGKTRRSAASARPKREGGTPTSRPARKAPGAARSARPRIEKTPELRFWERVWWGLLAVAFLSALANVLPQFRGNTTVVAVFWGIYAASIGGALYVQMGIIRKLRTEAIEAARKRRKGETEGKDR